MVRSYVPLLSSSCRTVVCTRRTLASICGAVAVHAKGCGSLFQVEVQAPIAWIRARTLVKVPRRMA